MENTLLEIKRNTLLGERNALPGLKLNTLIEIKRSTLLEEKSGTT